MWVLIFFIATLLWSIVCQEFLKKYCPRTTSINDRLSYFDGYSGSRIVIHSEAVRNENCDTSNVQYLEVDPDFEILQYVVSGGQIPFVEIGNGDFVGATGKIGGYSNKLMFHRIIEYECPEGMEYGYDKESCVVHKSEYAARKEGFDCLDLNSTQETESELYRSNMFCGSAFSSVFEIGAFRSDTEAADGDYLAERELVVTPDNLLVYIKMKNIVYQNPASTGIAIQLALLTKYGTSGTVKDEKIENIDANFEFPDYCSPQQDIFDIRDDSGLPKGYLSFLKWYYPDGNHETPSLAVVGKILANNESEYSNWNSNFASNYTEIDVEDLPSFVWVSFPARPLYIDYEMNLGLYVGIPGSCKENYEGSKCQSFSCFGVDHADIDYACGSLPNTQRGICELPNDCKCVDDQFFGDKCDIHIDTVVSSFIWGISIGVVCCLIACFVFIPMIYLTVCLCKRLGKFLKVEDLDIIIEEQKVAKDSTQAHMKINKELFQIDISSLKISKKIGQGGGSAVVFLAYWRAQKVAFKCFKVTDFLEEESIHEFEKECELLASVHFPFILKFYGATTDKSRLGFIMEFAQNGDLHNWLSSFKKDNGISYPLSEKIRMLKEISSAVGYLHSLDLIHRDLKLENVLVKKDESTRLMDFGLSKMSIHNNKTQTMRVGTAMYMAPEIMTGKYDKRCDAFSMSIVIYIVLTENFFPFPCGDSTFGIDTEISKDPNFRPTLKRKELSRDMKELLTRNWSHDPKKRDSFDELYKFFVHVSSDLEKMIKVKRTFWDDYKRLDAELEEFELLIKNKKVTKRKME